MNVELTFILYFTFVLLDLIEDHQPVPNSPALGQVILNPNEPDHLSERARSFQVSFNFWQLIVPDRPEDSNKKRKKAPPRKSPVPKYENYNPKVAHKFVVASPDIHFSVFRAGLFRSCDKRLAWVSSSLRQAWYDNTIDIQGFIHGSRHLKATKMAIDDNDSFVEFMKLAQSVAATTVMGFKIYHDNPKLTSNAQRNLEIARKSKEPKPASSDSDAHPESDDSSGILSLGERYNKKLWARFSKDFTAGENVTYALNPKDPSQCVVLNIARIRTWANDWAEGVAGVDEVNPPTKRPDFRWIPIADYQKEKDRLNGTTKAGPVEPTATSATVVHHNYYGAPFPSVAPSQAFQPPAFALPQTTLPAPTPAPTAPTDTTRLSPPPQNPPFEDFLNFAGITPTKKKTRNILAEEGIDNFGRLSDRKTYSFESFRSMGIAFAHADDLYKAVPGFLQLLKGSRET
ncbi:hypothetical protein DFH28DRAFT_897289 [Melampsora americana]|nr:hypothetical protein DFH28DRAFT_897289 [Melampsora americana]